MDLRKWCAAALALVLVLAGLPGSSRAEIASTPAACTTNGPVPCYTPTTLVGRTLWSITGLRPEQNRLIAVAPNHLSLQLIPKTSDWRPDNRWLKGPYVAQQLAGRPVIFTYVAGEDVADVAREWPVSKATADALLAGEPAVMVWSRAKGQPRVLLAARDPANLDRLTVCAISGTCPQLYADKVAPWNEVVPPAPKWAQITILVDLRQPVDNGTAVVYLSMPGRPKTQFNLSKATIWRPTALRALFRPEDGVRTAAMPDESAFRTDAHGQVVYEVNPYYQGSLTGSQVYHDLAFIWMQQLIPFLPVAAETPVAIQWLLPEGWSLNAPWTKTDGWYQISAQETRNVYVGLGKLAFSRFTVGDVSFTLAQMADSPAAQRDQLSGFTQKLLANLSVRLGPPPAATPKAFVITAYNRWMEGGGAGLRTVNTAANEKIMIHELIHWWNGVPYQSDQTWQECTTEYLTVRYMLDSGLWTKAQYDKNQRDLGAVKSAYGRATKEANVYGGDALAFARDLDEYIRKGSAGKYTLFDVIRYNAATGKAQATPEQIQARIREATGVDPAPLFAARW